MDTPRYPGDEPGDGGWHEPAHLGDGAGRDPDDAVPSPVPPAATGDLPPRGGPAPRPPDPLRQRLARRDDPWGVQAWALSVGWELSDGTGPRDAVLADVLAGGPLRLGKQARPAGVLRGRAGTLELVAFDVVEPAGRGWLSRYGVTAAPLLAPPPYLRLSPARFWKHRTGGLLQLPSGDPEFDTRWTLLTAEDSAAARRLVQDATLRRLLLGTDDGDEFWVAAGHLAVVRPDGQRPDLVQHHARLLAAAVPALSGGD